MIGLLLVVPAAIALLLGYAIPTGRTFITSFQDRPPLAGTESRFVGVENYRQVAGEFPGSVGLAVLTIAVPLLGLLVVAPLLAWLAHRAGTAGRRIARLALTFPVVLFAPAEPLSAGTSTGSTPTRRSSACWRCGYRPSGWYADRRHAFLAALRGRTRRPRGAGHPWPAVLTLVGLLRSPCSRSACGVHLRLPPGRPGECDDPAVRNGFQLLASGRAAADASLLLIVLMLLGIAAWLLVVLTGLRIELGGGPATRRPGGARRGAGRHLPGALAVLAITGYGLWPVLSRLGSTGPRGSASRRGAGQHLGTHLVSPIGVGLAAVAAFGIGWLPLAGGANCCCCRSRRGCSSPWPAGARPRGTPWR